MGLTKATYSMIDGATVNVKDFGAAGDGVTEDQAAIQAAIDYAFANGHNAVFFPAGAYYVNDQIDLANKVSLFGAGKSASEIYFGPSGKFQLIGTSLNKLGFFSICHMGMTNQGGGPTFCLGMSYAQHVLVFDCVVYNSGIGLSQFNYVTFRDCDFYGGELNASHDTINEICEALKLFNCNASSFAISIKDTTDVIIDSSHFLGATSTINIQRGEQPSGFYPQVTISNTIVDSTSDECLILAGVCPKVTNSFFSGGRTNLKNGVVIDDCTEGGFYSTTARYCGNDGFHISNSNGLTFAGCTANDNKRYGIRVGGSTNLCFIGNNMSYISSWYGGGYVQNTGFADEPSDCTYLTLIGNTAQNNSSSQIYVSGTTNTFAGNHGLAENQISGAFLNSVLKDGVVAPSATASQAKLYVDTTDGDLKVIFSDGTIKTIVTDT